MSSIVQRSQLPPHQTSTWSNRLDPWSVSVRSMRWARAWVNGAGEDLSFLFLGPYLPINLCARRSYRPKRWSSLIALNRELGRVIVDAASVLTPGPPSVCDARWSQWLSEVV